MSETPKMNETSPPVGNTEFKSSTDSNNAVSAESAVYTPEPNSTLAYIREKLEREKNGTSTRDLSKLVQVEHEATDIIFLAVGMNRDTYRSWRNRRFMEDRQHEDSGAAKRGLPVDRDLSDAFLLQNAILSSDGQKLDVKITEWLMTGEGFGPSTNMVLAAAEKVNPPRSDALNYEVALLMGKSALEVMMWRLMFECGLGKALLDWAAPSATDEEKTWAAHQLAKAEETVAELGVYFAVEDAARVEGITFREAALRKAADAQKTPPVDEAT